MKEKKPDELHVALLTQDEIRKWVDDETHWIVLFGREHSGYIDKLDEALGVYPTFPTLMSPLSTFIPKARVSREKMERALRRIGGDCEIGVGQDVFLLTQDTNEAFAMVAALRRICRPEESPR